ncbi:MAG: hypothetical protein LBE09_08195, partial [Christensenellaceae bacterium]|nr:hypothetical protein [Christensenellaceae bacterium]
MKNQADYRAVLEGLTEKSGVLRISSYIGDSSIPDTSKMLREVKTAAAKTVVLGLFQALAFIGGVRSIHNALDDIGNCIKKILVLSFGIEEIIEQKLKAYIPLKDKAQIYFVNGREEPQPKLALTLFELKSHNYYGSLKEYFLQLEECGGLQGVVKSQLTDKAFEGGIWSVSKPSTAYEALSEMDDTFTGIDESLGTAKQWKDLIEDITGTTFMDLLFGYTKHGCDELNLQ